MTEELAGSVALLGTERGGAFLAEQIHDGYSDRDNVDLRLISRVEEINPETKEKVRNKEQEFANLMSEIRSIANANIDREVTVSIAEVLLGGGSSNQIIKGLKPLLKEFPNLRVKLLLLQETIRYADAGAESERVVGQNVNEDYSSSQDEGGGKVKKIYSQSSEANPGQLTVTFSKTNYVLGEDVDHQVNREHKNSKKPIVLFNFKEKNNQLVSLLVYPKGETTSRDLLRAILEGKLNSQIEPYK